MGRRSRRRSSRRNVPFRSLTEPGAQATRKTRQNDEATARVLGELNQLLEAGAISVDEFEMAKAHLLGH